MSKSLHTDADDTDDADDDGAMTIPRLFKKTVKLKMKQCSDI